MTEAEAIFFFERETAASVRRLPISDARNFLRGLLLVAQSEALPELRAAYQRLCESDAHLELLAARQLKLPLPEPPPKPEDRHDGDGDGERGHDGH